MVIRTNGLQAERLALGAPAPPTPHWSRWVLPAQRGPNVARRAAFVTGGPARPAKAAPSPNHPENQRPNRGHFARRARNHAKNHGASAKTTPETTLKTVKPLNNSPNFR